MRKRKAEGPSASEGPNLKRTKVPKNAHGLKPFWNETALGLSRKLWCDTETASGGSEPNFSKGSPTSRKSGSWFKLETSARWTEEAAHESSWREIKEGALKKIAGFEDLNRRIEEYEKEKRKKPKEKPKEATVEPKKLHGQPRASRKPSSKPRQRKTPAKTRKPSIRPKKQEDDAEAKPRKKQQKVKKTILGLTKIKLCPSKEERQTLREWFSAKRWTYNRCVDGYRLRGYTTMKQLRAFAVNVPTMKREGRKWALAVHYEVRDDGARDFYKALKTSLKSGKAFDMSYRSRKKCKQETLTIQAKYWQQTNGAFAFLRTMLSQEPLPAVLPSDSRLIYDKAGNYYLCVAKLAPVLGVESQDPPKTTKICLEQEETEPKKSFIVSLDPGVRTFQTAYDPENESYHAWGRYDMDRVILPICERADQLKAKIRAYRETSRKGLLKPNPLWVQPALPVKGKWKKIKKHPDFVKNKRSSKRSHTLWSMKRALHRYHFRVKNLILEMHRKLILWLCENYEHILLPRFSTKEMTEGRRLASKTARSMYNWSHFAFRQRLQDKLKSYPGSKLLVVDESYTSQTCTRCGRLHKTSSETYECKHCGLSFHRDRMGARNILLKFLSYEHPAEALPPAVRNSLPEHFLPVALPDPTV